MTAKRYRIRNMSRVFPTVIRHATPLKPSGALAQRRTAKPFSLLADPNWSAIQISKTCRVSEHTVRAIRTREAQDIAERKKSLAAMLANVAELGAGRMEETVGKVGCRDAAIVTGIATDKMLALTGQTPVGIQIANIVMPTPEQREERRRAHRALDEITRLLAKPGPLDPKEELMIKAQLCGLGSGRSADD